MPRRHHNPTFLPIPEDKPVATLPLIADKVFVFTGKLASMTRHRAGLYVQEAGGLIRSSVSRLTDYLIVGEDGWPLEEGEISLKLELGLRLRDQSEGIQILTERQWLDLLGLESKYPHESRLFSTKTCCQLLKISRRQLRQWRSLGLIAPVQTIHREDFYNFQHLKALRTLDDLVARGLKPGKIRKILASLEPVLGDIESPLAQLNVLTEKGQILFQYRGEQFDLGGQLCLDFRDKAEAPGQIVDFVDSGDAWELYWEAEQLLTHPETRQPGLDLLERVIGLQPDFADVYCLQGNVQFAEGFLENARASFEKALELEPTYAEAWFNLGNIFDRYSNWLGAVRAYKNALRSDPDFDGAHFNLALLYEEAGDIELAGLHWRRYLEVAADPEWIAIAQEHLREEEHL